MPHHYAFLSPAATSASSPHQSTSPEGLVQELTPTSPTVIRELLELIDALDRRVPQMQRAGEAAIARDASALKAQALQRVAELERVLSGVEEV